MTTWAFGGIDLSTYGKVMRIDDYLDLPETRGQDITLSYRHGSKFVEKFFEPKKIILEIGISETDVQAIEAKFDAIRKNFGKRGQQLLVCTLADSSVRQAYARVESIMQVRRTTGRIAKVVVEFTLSEPFFRSDTLSTFTQTIDANPKAMDVENVGTVEERNPTIVLTGPLENVVITNPANGFIWSYTGVIADGDTVTFNQDADGQYTAIHSVSGEVIGNVNHQGDTAFMVIETDEQTLSIASVSPTTGTVEISFYPPYF